MALPLLLGVAAGFSLWVYHRRELPVPGRGWLALARALAIALVLLLIWNPRLPAGAGDGLGQGAFVLLDGSLSMAAEVPGGETAWSVAVREARRLANGGGRILVFGDAVTTGAADQLEGRAPTATSSHLLPALRVAAESGARAVTVVSDGRLTDADFGAPPAVPGVRVDLRRVDAAPVNAGIAVFATPARAERGTPFGAEVVVFGQAGAATAALIEVREEGRLVGSVPVEIPPPGRVARTPVDLPAPATEGLVRYTATVTLDGDGFAADDQRVRHVRVAPPETGLVLLSLRPDWEPRHLLPVLEDVTGLPARGYLRVAGSRYLPLGRGAEVADEVGEGELRGLLATADIVVLHGVDATAPDWVRDAAQSARRVLMFPADRAGASMGGVAVAAGLEGEWYVAADLPASPLAGQLAGLDLGALPPLTAIQPAEAPSGSVALRAHLGGRGTGEAALVLISESNRRLALGLADGYWRWAARAGTPRRAYRSLWAGVANWLFAGERLATAGPPGPVESVIARGSPVRWRAPGMAGRELDLRLARGGDTVVASTVAVDSTEAFTTAPLDPGAYGFTLSTGAGTAGTSGRFDVEHYTDELRVPPVADALDDERDQAGARATPGRRLRTHPAPFILVLALLCGEWIGRRRQGLR